MPSVSDPTLVLEAPPRRRQAIPRGVAVAAGLLLSSALLTAPLLPLFDPDEGYYPATAAESVDAGRAWDPQFNGEPRWDKPILTYALIEASFAAFGRSATAARVPSAVQGALLVLVVGLIVSRLCGARAGSLCAFVLVTTLGVQIFSRVAHPEIAIVLAITTVELLTVVWLTTPVEPRRWLPVVIGAAAGYGVLAKGPVALVLPACAALAMAPFVRPVRGWRLVWRDLASATVAVLVIAGAWFLAMTTRHGLSFVHEAIWRHNVGRYAGTAFEHRSAPWFFVLPTLIALFPWSAFVPGAVARLSRADRSPTGVLRLYMTGAALTAFVFYSVSASKLPHYALAIVPPLAIVIGLYLDEITGRERGSRWSFRVTTVLLACMALALAATPWLLNRLFTARALLGGAPGQGVEPARLLAIAVWPSAILLALGAAAAWRLRGPARLTSMLVVGTVLPFLFIVSACTLFRAAYPWERFGRQIRETPGPVWMVGPRAPSLTFYAARPVRRLTEAEFAEHVPQMIEGWIIADRNRLLSPGSQPLGNSRIEVVDDSGHMALVRVCAGECRR